MKFPTEFMIGSKKVGGDAPCFVIAEAGVAHFGDMKLAEELVDLASNAGADVFKTQIFDVDVMISKYAPEWKDRLRPRNLNFDQVAALKDLCEKKGLIFITTAHDESRIEWLKKLNVDAIKVGSGEKTNHPFIEQLSSLKKPMIISTGMCNDDDVKGILRAVENGGGSETALLHCVTSYPVPHDQINLNSMNTLSKYFNGPIGYSDHSTDGLPIIAAVAKGAKVIERHITILKNVPNAQDWKVSSDPDDFPKLVREIRSVESMLGTGIKQSAPCEKAGEEWALKSLVTSRFLSEGHKIVKKDVLAKRPGTGISPTEINKILGKKLTKGLKKGDMFEFKYLG